MPLGTTKSRRLMIHPYVALLFYLPPSLWAPLPGLVKTDIKIIQKCFILTDINIFLRQERSLSINFAVF